MTKIPSGARDTEYFCGLYVYLKAPGFKNHPNARKGRIYGGTFVGCPSFVTVDKNSGNVTAAPNDDEGIYYITLHATTKTGSAKRLASSVTKLTVDEVLSAPTLAAIAPVNIVWGQTATIQLVAGNIDGLASSTTYSCGDAIEPCPSYVSLDDQSGLVTISPSFSDVGARTVKFSVSNPGGSASRDASISVAYLGGSGSPLAASIASSGQEGTKVGDTLTCTTFNDGGLPKTYVWTSNNEEILYKTASSIVVEADQAHSAIKCSASIFVNGNQETANSQSVEVLNSQPSVSVNISQTDSDQRTLVSDELLCQATQSDVDFDAISTTYSWTKNGQIISGATSSTFVVTASEAHSTLQCQVAVDDGKGGTASANSIDLTVDNTAPIFAAQPSINATSPTFSGSTISCQGAARAATISAWAAGDPPYPARVPPRTRTAIC